MWVREKEFIIHQDKKTLDKIIVMKSNGDY